MRFLSLLIFIALLLGQETGAAWVSVSCTGTSRQPQISSLFSRYDRHLPVRWPPVTVSSRTTTTITSRTQPLQLLEHPTEFSLILASEGESWRQYIPLVVSIGVIVDILLGSPLANGIIRQLNKDQIENEQDGEKGDNVAPPSSANNFMDLVSGSKNRKQIRNSDAGNTQERVDSEKIAAEAISKARNTLELRNYLERNKTDWDRMQDMKRKFDQQTYEIDQKLEERRRELEK